MASPWVGPPDRGELRHDGVLRSVPAFKALLGIGLHPLSRLGPRLVPAASVRTPFPHQHAIDGPWDVRFERAAASLLFAKRSPRVWLVEVQAVNISAARFYCLQRQVSAVDAYKHRVVGGYGGDRPSAPARRVESPPSAPAHHVGHAPYGHGALVDVVVARKDEVHPMLREKRLQVFPHFLVTAVPRGAIGRPVQEDDPPVLARGGQVSLQEVSLLLRVRTPITVIQLAVERDEVGVAPVEGVVALGATRTAERRVEVLEKGGTVPLPHVVVAEDREYGHSLDEVS